MSPLDEAACLLRGRCTGDVERVCMTVRRDGRVEISAETAEGYARGTALAEVDPALGLVPSEALWRATEAP